MIELAQQFVSFVFRVISRDSAESRLLTEHVVVLDDIEILTVLRPEKVWILLISFCTKAYEQYPDLFWSKNSKNLYVVENYYVFSKKTAFCRISRYNTENKTYKLLCKLDQKGDAASYYDGKLLPYFTPVKVANDKYLILQVPTAPSGEGNYHVLAVDLGKGSRIDVMSFTSSVDIWKVPMLDWIDE